MIRFLLTLARLLLTAWVGGAALFVITSIAEQESPDFSSMIRDQLATIRFPLYYLFALLTLLPATVLLSLLMMFQPMRHKKLMILACLLAVGSSAVAAVDYVVIYSPLQELITPPGKARNQEFMRLHGWSRHINEVHVSMALVASVITCSVRLSDDRIGSPDHA